MFLDYAGIFSKLTMDYQVFLPKTQEGVRPQEPTNSMGVIFQKTNNQMVPDSTRFWQKIRRLTFLGDRESQPKPTLPRAIASILLGGKRSYL